MLLLPALTLIAGLALGGFGLALSKIQLEVEAFQKARLYAIEGVTDSEVQAEGRFSCVTLSKPGLIPIEANSCVIRYGG